MMNTSLLRSLAAVLALGSALTLTASDQPGRFVSIESTTARVNANGATVAAGASRIMVSLRLGTPNAVLQDGSWLYSGYKVDSAQGGTSLQGSLVVRFSRGKVVTLGIADNATVLALRSAPGTPAVDTVLIAASSR